jgi:beta-glucosidase
MQVPFPSDAAPLGMKPAEDCLYLNIWRPAQSAAKLPVLVWIYGGGFVNGGSSPAVYDGAPFARDGVLFVSFNYRLGRFGFFAHPALAAEQAGAPLGNYAIMDQIAALKWVRRNIAAFGGDPDNVTICGESAGGMSVHILMTSPESRGLFQKAIVQSGGGRANLMRGRPISGGTDSAEAIGLAFAKQAGIEGTDAQALQKLRALPADALLNGLNMASMQAAAATYAGGPVLDGKIMPVQPAQAYAAGKGAKVPFMVGANSMDIGFMQGSTLAELLSQFGPHAAKARTVYKVKDTDDVKQVALRMGGDQMMAEPARWVARERAGHGQSVYEYRFWTAAREAITLLKNEHGLLPLDKSRLHSLAVIGPNADVPLYEGGGSAGVVPAHSDTPLVALRTTLGIGVKIDYVAGADNDPLPPPADPRVLSADAQRKQPGLKYSYYNNATFAGPPAQSGVEPYFDKIMLPATQPQMSMRWEGFVWPDQDGKYELSLSDLGEATLYVDGRKVIGPDLGTLHPAQIDFGAPTRVASVSLEAARSYRVRVDYVTRPIQFHSLRFGLRRPPSSIEAAVRAAKNADAAIVFVGSSRSTDTEGHDRPDMELAGTQNELVSAVLAANPNTIVVLNSGAPVALPWVDRAPALLEAWLAGEGEPAALAQILFGEANPSGKLPCTFPRRLQDNPAYLYYSPGRDANYGEGVFVGYRYYDKRGVEPLFPFGHGLSYTTFEYGKLRVPARATAAQPLEVAVDVKNTGRRVGEETVQLYIGDEATRDVVRSVRELRAFQKISLAPGESRTVNFTLSARDFSYYDVHQHNWSVTPGKYRIDVGSSSRDIRQSQELQWAAPPDPRAPAPAEATAALDLF